MNKLLSTTAIVAAAATMVAVMTPSAHAGGFAVREQSSSLIGMAFAGAATGIDLSSAYWNAAAFSNAAPGITTESHFALITAKTELDGRVVNDGVTGSAGAIVTGTANALNNGAPTSTEIDRPAVVASSYAAYRISDKLVLGVSSGAPFGLSSEPDDSDYTGRQHGLNASMLTFNITPTVSYEVMNGVNIAAGIQLQYMNLGFKFQGQPGTGTEVDVSDEIGVGFTLGIMLKPAEGTAIGVGFRSKVEHNLEGELRQPGQRPTEASADFETPEILTVSISQALASNIRVHASYEWTNWSRFDTFNVRGTAPLDLVASLSGGTIPAEDRSLSGPWEDGHFVSGGLEYDMNEQLTLRTGVAWERSPIRTPEARLLQVPDTDRVWLSLGASYQFSEMTTFDFGYTHIFFKDGDINRSSLSAEGLNFQGTVNNRADIFAVSMKTKWGENGLQEMLGSLLGGGGH